MRDLRILMRRILFVSALAFAATNTVMNPAYSQNVCKGFIQKFLAYLGLGDRLDRAKSFDEIASILRERGLEVTTADVKEVRPVYDTKFGDFQYKGQSYVHAQLSAWERAVKLGTHLYFGRGASSLADAEGQARAMFRDGRSRSPDGHRDLYTHIVSTKNEPSSFIQATKSLNVAWYFAEGNKAQSPKDFGVIYVIDPAGAPVLDVDHFLLRRLKLTRYVQREVVFMGTLSPYRVVGALIIGRRAGDAWVPLGLLRNPNYAPNLATVPAAEPVSSAKP